MFRLNLTIYDAYLLFLVFEANVTNTTVYQMLPFKYPFLISICHNNLADSCFLAAERESLTRS